MSRRSKIIRFPEHRSHLAKVRHDVAEKRRQEALLEQLEARREDDRRQHSLFLQRQIMTKSEAWYRQLIDLSVFKSIELKDGRLVVVYVPPPSHGDLALL